MRKFKGIELPVNSVIVIALAIFVLLMLASFFGKSSEGFTDTQYQSAFYSACAQWSNNGCSDTDFSSDKIKTSMNDGKTAFSLRQVCQSYLKDPSADVDKCKNACTSCPKKFVGSGTPCTTAKADSEECDSLLTRGWDCVSGNGKTYCCPDSTDCLAGSATGGGCSSSNKGACTTRAACTASGVAGTWQDSTSTCV